MRNVVNTLRLSLAAMELETTAAPRVQWLDAIITTAEQGEQIVDGWLIEQEEHEFTDPRS